MNTQTRSHEWLRSPYLIGSLFVFVIFSYFFIDRQLAVYFRHLTQTGWLHPFVPYIDDLTQLGKSHFYFIGFSLLAVINFFTLKNKKVYTLSGYLFLTTLLSGVICVIIKIILSRARPDLLFDKQLYGFYFFHTKASYWSYPSGHSTTISAIMVAMSFLYRRLAPIFLLAMLVICSSRIILDAHYLSDVVTGIYLGAIVSSYLYLKQVSRIEA